MAKYKFKFNTIKEIKEKLEKKAKKELSVIELKIKRQQTELIEINKLLKNSKNRKTQNKLTDTEELHFLEKYENYLSEKISIIDRQIQKLMIERKGKVEELIERSKETKTFSKLEEKHRAEFNEFQNKAEQKEQDEIAVQEFLRE